MKKFKSIILLSALFIGFIQASEQETMELLEKHFDNIITYMNAVDKYQPLFDLMKVAVLGDIKNMEMVVEDPEVDFFETDIKYRPQFYALIEQSALILQTYFIDNPEKNPADIKKAQSNTRTSVNKFLLYLYKNRDQAQLSKELVENFYQSYFAE